MLLVQSLLRDSLEELGVLPPATVVHHRALDVREQAGVEEDELVPRVLDVGEELQLDGRDVVVV